MRKKLKALLLIGVFAMTMFATTVSVEAATTVTEGWYMISSGTSSGTKVLDINNNNMKDEGNLEIYQKNYTPNQVFYIKPVKKVWGTQYYSIMCAHSQKYLDVYGAKKDNGANCQQYSWHGGDNQLWCFEKHSGSTYYIKSKLGTYLDNDSNRNTNGNNVLLWRKTGNVNQRWTLIKVNKPKLNVSVSNLSIPRGTVSTENYTVSGKLTSNYPITKIKLFIYNPNGKCMQKKEMTASDPKRNGTFKSTFDIRTLANGNYYFRMRVYNIAGKYVVSQKCNFTKSDVIVVPLSAKNTKRTTVVSYMRSMATVLWTPQKSFTHWSGGRTWTQGTYYNGIPYSQSTRNTTLEAFRANMKGATYIGPSKQSTYMGSDCSSTVSMAWKKADSTFSITNTEGLLPGHSKISKVGSYSWSSAYQNNTKRACTNTGKDKMEAAYKQLKPGDAVVERHTSGNSKSGHTMMVSSVSTSGIYVIEQTTYDDKIKSSWRVDKYYSFATLYSNGYVPVKLSTID